MTTYLLRLEAVNLDHFVYDTQDISTIRGGGLTLLYSPEWVRARFPLEPVTVGASSGIFEAECADAEAADALREQVEEFLTRSREPFLDLDGQQREIHLGLATFVVDAVEASGGFVRDRERLLAKNRWRQMHTPALAVPLAVPETPGPCEVDRLRPAVPGFTTKKGEVSASVHQRWRRGRAQKQKFYEENTELEFEKGFSEDLEKLTSDPSRGNLHSKMAVIYVDGNGFGALQDRRCSTVAQQREFDEHLRRQRRTMLTDLLRRARDRDEAFHEGGPDGPLRFETLLWGGDEILWVVPAWRGLETVRQFFTAAASWDSGGTDPEPLTHACGLVLCHHNAPIAQIRRLAQDLAEIAKAASRERNLVAYQVLESFDHVAGDLAGFRRARCPVGVDSAQLLLHPTELGRALDLASDLLPDLPHGKVVEIAQRLLESPPGSESEDTGDERDSVTVSRRTLPEVQERLCGSLDGVTHGRLEELLDAFGGEPVGWLHLAELWDYLTPAPGAAKGEG